MCVAVDLVKLRLQICQCEVSVCKVSSLIGGVSLVVGMVLSLFALFE